MMFKKKGLFGDGQSVLIMDGTQITADVKKYISKGNHFNFNRVRSRIFN